MGFIKQGRFQIRFGTSQPSQCSVCSKLRSASEDRSGETADGGRVGSGVVAWIAVGGLCHDFVSLRYSYYPSLFSAAGG